MSEKLQCFISKLPFVALLLISSLLSGQTISVFNDDFTTSAGTTYTNTNGSIGSSTTWSLLRSGTDYGAAINGGRLILTNDASGASNVSGWVLAYTTTAGFASPYNAILASNAGLVTWNFNMRQSRGNPSGPGSGLYGNAFILAGTSNTTATTGSGYAVILGNSGKVDPLRLVRYTAGLRTSTNILSSNTTGLTDFGNQYLSVRVTYNPSNNQWAFYVRNDGSIFQDPAVGNMVLQGTAVNNLSTGVLLPLMGAFWNSATRSNQTALYDNVSVTVAIPSITSISPASRVAGTGAFTLTVTGTNFNTSSVVRWNGVARTTTYTSPTQISASILASDITSAGTVPVSVINGTAVSNSLNFTVNPAADPSISTSTTSLPMFTTVSGTASASQNFTSSGANLTGNITITAPANFEVSLNNSTFTDAVTVTGTSTPVYVRVKATAPAGVYNSNLNIELSTPGGASKQVGVTAVVLATEPTVQASAVTFSNVNASSFTVNFTPGNGTGRLVVIRSASAVNAAPADGVVYTPATAFGAGADLGNGNYIVYAASGSSVTVTGLTAATTYHVAVYEYNGTGGTQNYRTTSPATGSRLTLNAALGVQLFTANTPATITFDNTVDGSNSGIFQGAGIDSAPTQGELNSNGWAFTGFSSGNVAFGGSSAEDTDYDSGPSEGGETEGGLYAFEVAPDNFALGIQPAAGDFAPGTATLRIQNQSGGTITSLSIAYKVYVYNDEAGSNSFNFSHSANNSTYTDIAALNFTTGAAADAVPGWKAHYRVVTLTGLSLANNAYYYLRWSGATVSGTAFDEIALDDIVVVPNPSTNFASLSGTAETFVVAGNALLSGNTTVNGTITFLNNSWLSVGSNTLTLSGTVTNTTTGGLRGSAASSLVINGSVNQTLSFDQTTAGTTNLFNNLSIATTNANTVTAGNALAVNGSLNIDSGQTLNLGTSTLSGSLTTIVNNGTLTTQNTGATPFTAGRTWSGTGTVQLNSATTAQTLVSGTYNNLTVSTTGGAVQTGNVTVNGTLNLPNANPSATLGSLSTGSNTLFMGGNATNTGVGDVSGTITRNTGITSNVLYTFGHPETAIIFPPNGTLPTSMSIRTVLGSAPAGKTDGILRTYDFIQTGGIDTKAIIRAHYLDSELNGNTETRLADWVVVVSPLTVIEQGRSNYSTVDNYVELANVNVAFFSSSFGNRLLTLANSQVGNSVWNGSVSNSWTTAANWTPNAVPGDNTTVIIPAGTPNSPTINPTTTIGRLTIESGATVNTPLASQFNITGTSGAWINNGTFNAAALSTVAFNGTGDDVTMAGTTTFNNITVASGTTLRPLTNNVMRIGGTFTKSGLFIAGAVHNTVEYTGVAQNVVSPDGATAAYYNLTVSGSAASFPSSLNVNGNITLNQSVNFSGTTINFQGNEDQYISGSASPSFNNVVINKAMGEVYLATNTTVGGVLTLTSGRLNLGTNNLTLGSAAVSGSFSATTMIVADGTGVVRRPFTGTGMYFFPIGEKTSNTTYSPISVSVTSGTFSNAFVAVNVTDAIHPNNNSTSSYLTRYWSVTQTGISNAVATVIGTYVPGDAVGGEATLSSAQLNGVFNRQTNPWVKYTTLSGNTLTAIDAPLTAGQTSVFTGITAQNITVTINGEGTFCVGDVVTLTTEVSGGDGPYTYEWTGGLGTADTATPPTTTAGTYNYMVTVRDANGITSIDNAEIEVSEGPVAGTLSGEQAICAGSTPVSVTLTGYTGTIVRWERSTTTAFANPAFIFSTSPTLTGAEIGNITSTRYIRAVIQNGSCPVVYSNPVAITVATTTWDGTTWSNGAPNATTAAVFNGNFTASADIIACSVQVTGGATVVIPSGTNITLNGSLIVTSGSFTLRNNANLLQLTEAVNSGNIIVERNSSELYRQDYTMWSSPVTGSKTLLQFSPETVTNRFYTYNTVTDQYNTISPSNTFSVAQGYLIRMPNGSTVPGYNVGTTPIIFTGVFEGVPHNGFISRTLNSAGNGYNFTGNPYPSPINIPAFLTDNQDAIDGTIWIWRKTNNPNSINSAYVTINSTGQYVGNGEPEQENPSGILRTGQGFIVKVKEGNTSNAITFNNTMRSDNTSNQFFRLSSEVSAVPEMPESHGIWLNLTNAGGFFSQMYTGYIAGATNGRDYGIDSRYINDSPIVLAVEIDDAEYIIQGRSMPFTPADVVPLTFRTNNAGTFTIAIDHMEGLFNGNQAVYLRDNTTDIVHDLKASPYTFATETGTFSTRFEIVYVNEALDVDVPSVTANDVIVYKDGRTLHITSGKALIENVVVFDMRGRMLYNTANINSNSHSIDTLQAEEQVLIMNIITEYGKVTKKIIY